MAYWWGCKSKITRWGMRSSDLFFYLCMNRWFISLRWLKNNEINDEIFYSLFIFLLIMLYCFWIDYWCIWLFYLWTVYRRFHTSHNRIYHRFCYSDGYSFDFWYEEVNYYLVIKQGRASIICHSCLYAN